MNQTGVEERTGSRWEGTRGVLSIPGVSLSRTSNFDLRQQQKILNIILTFKKVVI